MSYVWLLVLGTALAAGPHVSSGQLPRHRYSRRHLSHQRVSQDMKKAAGATCVNGTGQYINWADHGNHSAGAYYQRYFSNIAYFRDNGPLFLYMGGESELESWTVCSGFIIDLAKIHGAMVIALEHRFYGKSMPCETFSDCRELLSMGQALNDTKTFLQSMRYTDQKVVVFGGSYPGVLAALLRSSEFGSSIGIVGSVSSSAPMDFKVNFSDYEKIGVWAANQYNKSCMENIQRLDDAVNSADEDTLEDHDLAPCVLRTAVAGQSLSYGLPMVGAYFQYWFNDWQQFEYLCGNVSIACQDNDCSTQGGALDAAREVIFGDFDIDVDPKFCTRLRGKTCTTLEAEWCERTCGVNCVQNSVDYEAWDLGLNPEMETWYWQKCTEFGYFKTCYGGPCGADGEAFFKGVCDSMFGDEWPAAEAARLTAKYGGLAYNATEVIFVNGQIDPWSGLGIKSPNNDRQWAFVLDWGAHCEDMFGREYEDINRGLKELHDSIAEIVQGWVGSDASPSDTEDSMRQGINIITV